jgi:hypothetical protein
MALGRFGQFALLIDDGLLAGRDPKIQSNSHSFPHSENVRFRYVLVSMAPTSIKWAFLDGENRYPFCIPSDILMARLICQPLNREMLLRFNDLWPPPGPKLACFRRATAHSRNF